MEMVHGFRYSKVKQDQDQKSVGDSTVPTRVWRSVKRVAGRFTRRRRLRRKLLPAVVVRRVVLWASVQVQKRRVYREVCDARRRRSNDSVGQRQVILNYDIFSYSKNFDDGKWQQEEVDFYGRRSFSYRFADIHANQESPLI